MNNFSAKLSVSPVTGHTTVYLEINGQKITLRLVNDSTTLAVDSRNSGLTINTRMKSMSVDSEFLTSEIGALGLSKKVERQLERRGIEFIYQIVDRGNREKIFDGQMNSNREKWCDEIEAALAKRGLFLGMALPEPPKE